MADGAASQPTPDVGPTAVADSSQPSVSSSASRVLAPRCLRFHRAAEPTECSVRIGIVVGKTHDPVVSAEWMKQRCGEEGMYQSDEAVGQYISLRHPHVGVTIVRPRRPADIPRSMAQLQDCHTIHVLESEQFLPHHDYRHYERLFRELQLLGARVRPSLTTMRLIMSKVEYIDLLARHGIPHVPTFVLPRPTNVRDLDTALRRLPQWLQGLDPVPLSLITKPSHSGSKLHFQRWPIPTLQSAPWPFVRFLRHLLIGLRKPAVLIQPFLQGLADKEYRLYFIHRAFVSCVSTQWWVDKKGLPAMRRDPIDDPAILDELRPIAQRAVDLLPPDSALYRVDMFFHDGRCAINEIEMIDADLMPEYHGGDLDIVQLVGDALVAMGAGDVTPGATDPLPAPDLDPETSAAAVVGDGDRGAWRAVVCALRGALKGLDPRELGLRATDRTAALAWADLLASVLADEQLKAITAELGLPARTGKRARAFDLGLRLVEDDAPGEGPAKRAAGAAVPSCRSLLAKAAACQRPAPAPTRTKR